MSHHQNSSTDCFFPNAGICQRVILKQPSTRCYWLIPAAFYSICLCITLLHNMFSLTWVALTALYSAPCISPDIFKKKVDKSYLPPSTLKGQIISWYLSNASVHGRNWMGDSQCSAEDKWCYWPLLGCGQQSEKYQELHSMPLDTSEN